MHFGLVQIHFNKNWVLQVLAIKLDYREKGGLFQ